jgi:histidinol-phosphatase (PHP family)
VSRARLNALADCHGHAKGEHPPYAVERPVAYTPRMLLLWFYHAARRGGPRFMMVTDHLNYACEQDPAAVSVLRAALRCATRGAVREAAELAGVTVAQATVVADGLAAGMRFSIGSEMDDDARAHPGAAGIVAAMQPDGLIQSVHVLTIDHPEFGPAWDWPFDNPEFSAVYETVGIEATWEAYVAKLLGAIETQPCHIAGHFHVPAKFGHWPRAPVLEAYEDDLVATCARRGVAIELNTRFFYRHAPGKAGQRFVDANLRLLKKAKAARVGIVLSSDAHRPGDQGNAFDLALNLLDEAGIRDVVFPVGGELKTVRIA